MTVPTITNSISCSSLRLGLLLSLVFVCFGLSPAVRAVVPAPDGGYPDGNTVEGDFGLQSLTIGIFNTANGVRALLSSTGGFNAAVGHRALANKTTGTGNIAVGWNAGSNLHTGGGNIHIGNPGFAPAESDTISIGNSQTRTFIAGISNVD